MLVGFHHLGHAAVVVGIKQVFGKIGGQDHHFIPRVQQGLEDDVEPAGSPAGEDHVLGLELQAVETAEHLGQGLARLQKPGVGHVGVEAGAQVAGRLDQFRLKPGRRLQVGVTQGEIIDLVRPQAGLESAPSSNMRLIQDEFWMAPRMRVEMGMDIGVPVCDCRFSDRPGGVP